MSNTLGGLTLGEFRRLTANMADDAILVARDRDCINLDQVHIVGIQPPEGHPSPHVVQFVPTIDEVYGGDEFELDGSKQAVVFCGYD